MCLCLCLCTWLLGGGRRRWQPGDIEGIERLLHSIDNKLTAQGV
jgi:hypothetical protein